MAPIYDPKTYVPSKSLPQLMGRVRGALLEAIDHELEPYEITTAQWLVLMNIANGMANQSSEVCSILTADPGAMTRMIDRLERRGLVRRVRSPDDRRAVKLELTAEGKALYPKLLPIVVGVINRFLRGFSKQEVQQMEGFLKRMLANA